jgi:tight adherence protein C
MLLLAIFALALAGTAVGLLLWGMALPRARATARVEQIGTYGHLPDTSATPAGPQRRSVISALARRLGDALANRLGGYEEWVRRGLVAAGIYRITPRAFMGYQCLAAVAMAALVMVAFAGEGPLAVMLAAMAAALVTGVPILILRMRARTRVGDIDRGVPDLIDMLVVTIEAGMGFSAALQAASSRLGGPLGDELRLTMQEQRMGMTLRESLTNLGRRVDAPAMHSFVRSVTQGETLGVSVGTVMRNLAREMRVRRRQMAEERAQKAPVKMLFPLVFLMFPSLGIVLLGPAIIEITQSMGK